MIYILVNTMLKKQEFLNSLGNKIVLVSPVKKEPIIGKMKIAHQTYVSLAEDTKDTETSAATRPQVPMFKEVSPSQTKGKKCLAHSGYQFRKNIDQTS